MFNGTEYSRIYLTCYSSSYDIQSTLKLFSKSQQRVLLNTLQRLVSSHQIAGRINFIETLHNYWKSSITDSGSENPPPPPSNKVPFFSVKHSKSLFKIHPPKKTTTHQPSLVNFYMYSTKRNNYSATRLTS